MFGLSNNPVAWGINPKGRPELKIAKNNSKPVFKIFLSGSTSSLFRLGVLLVGGMEMPFWSNFIGVQPSSVARKFPRSLWNQSFFFFYTSMLRQKRLFD
jgi:hypothetical protein